VEDADELGLRMRESDRLEVWASGKFGPTDAVKDSLRVSSFARSVFYDGKLSFMFGVAPLYGSMLGVRAGAPWTLTSDLVAKHPKIYVQVTRELLPLLFKDYDVLINFVDARYRASIRWLEVLGFHIGKPVEYGENKELFCPFILDREGYVRASHYWPHGRRYAS
jgi:hypothetical protein